MPTTIIGPVGDISDAFHRSSFLLSLLIHDIRTLFYYSTGKTFPPTANHPHLLLTSI